MRKMNILITTFSFPSFKDNIFDGKFIFSEAVSYAENGARVRVVTPHYYGAKKVEKIHKGITVLRFRYFFPKSLQVLKVPGLPLYSQKSLLSIIQIPFLCLFFSLNILKHAAWADIIHAQWTPAAFLSLPAKWLLGTKIVVTARGSDLRLLPVWINRFIHYQVDAAIDCFGPQPRNVAYKRRFSARFITLPLIVHNDATGRVPDDIRGVVDGKEDAFIILYVGRFDKGKLRHDRLPVITLIHASKILKERGMKFHVFYIGGGDASITRELLELVDAYGLQGYVTLLGVRTDVTDYIQCCHLGVGGIALNAVSQEFAINGKAQILIEGRVNEATPWRHGVNALFVRPDDPEDMAQKLQWSIENRERVKKIGENAREEMGKYVVDSKKGGALYLKEFRNLIGAEKSG
jgi:glycosyltransferase involved in cell wall biosynthesis